MNAIRTNGGLVKLVLVILVVLLIIAYFGVNLRGIVNSSTFQDNWSLIKDALISLWNNYLSVPFAYVWNQIFVNLIWNPIFHHLQDNAAAAVSPR